MSYLVYSSYIGEVVDVDVYRTVEAFRKCTTVDKVNIPYHLVEVDLFENKKDQDVNSEPTNSKSR